MAAAQREPRGARRGIAVVGADGRLIDCDAAFLAALGRGQIAPGVALAELVPELAGADFGHRGSLACAGGDGRPAVAVDVRPLDGGAAVLFVAPSAGPPVAGVGPTPERTAFLGMVARALAGAHAEPAGGVALMIVAVEGGLGLRLRAETAGDPVIAACAERLRRALGPERTVAALGGAELAVLFEPGAGESAPEALAQAVIGACAAPFTIDGAEVHLAARVGVAVAAAGEASAATLMQHADAALGAARIEARPAFRIFDRALGERLREQVALRTEIRRAIARGEFELFYQPVVALDSGRLAGFEALVYWRHPERGLIGPDRFIAAAEAAGLIVPLGNWTLQAACRQLALWRKAGLAGIEAVTIGVNVSGGQFATHELIDHARAALRATGAPAQAITLEITETLLLEDPDFAAEALADLKALDFRLAMDDFGSGHSALGYLLRYPFDTLKVDREFVRGLDRDPQRRAVVRVLALLADALGMTIVAEGVETGAELDALRALGYDYGQGFYFARPLDAAAAERLIAERPTW